MGRALQTPLPSIRNSIRDLALKMQTLLYDTWSRSSVISRHQVILGKFMKFVFGGHLSPWVQGKQAVPALSLLGDLKWAFSVRFQRLYNTVIGTWDQLRWDKKKNNGITCWKQVFSPLYSLYFFGDFNIFTGGCWHEQARKYLSNCHGCACHVARCITWKLKQNKTKQKKHEKYPKCPLMDEWLNKMWYL